MFKGQTPELENGSSSPQYVIFSLESTYRFNFQIECGITLFCFDNTKLIRKLE